MGAGGRLTVLRALEDHPWYGQKVKGLSVEARQRIIVFITQNDELSATDFAVAINVKFTGADKLSLLLSEILFVVNKPDGGQNVP